jgi:uncharacterized protein
MNTPHEDEVLVRDAPDRSRFEITVNGELAGFAEYRSRPDHLTFTHTEVSESFQGRGLAGRLIRTALDTARRRGLRVIPLCPYVAGFIRKHQDYLDLVDDRYRGHVAAG